MQRPRCIRKTYLKVWMLKGEPTPRFSRHGSARKVGDQHPNPKVQEGSVGRTNWDKMQGVTGYEEFWDNKLTNKRLLVLAITLNSRLG